MSTQATDEVWYDEVIVSTIVTPGGEFDPSLPEGWVMERVSGGSALFYSMTKNDVGSYGILNVEFTDASDSAFGIGFSQKGLNLLRMQYDWKFDVFTEITYEESIVEDTGVGFTVLGVGEDGWHEAVYVYRMGTSNCFATFDYGGSHMGASEVWIGESIEIMHSVVRNMEAWC